MFSALLDTCVLVPSRARDVLLEAASTGVYRPLWSSEILAELDCALRLLQTRRGMAAEETDAYLVRLFRQLETSFPDALVTDWESSATTATSRCTPSSQSCSPPGPRPTWSTSAAASA